MLIVKVQLCSVRFGSVWCGWVRFGSAATHIALFGYWEQFTCPIQHTFIQLYILCWDNGLGPAQSHCIMYTRTWYGFRERLSLCKQWLYMYTVHSEHRVHVCMWLNVIWYKLLAKAWNHRSTSVQSKNVSQKVWQIFKIWNHRKSLMSYSIER